MGKKPNTHGGGARTNELGLKFEQTTSLNDALTSIGYRVDGFDVIDPSGEKIGLSVPKAKLYKQFLEKNNIFYKDYNSKQWQPDEAFVNYRNKTVYIIEKKFQHESGSVDEKLPNCEFKKQEYEKLCTPIGYKVKFYYVLNDWFKDGQYRDTLQYIKDKNCSYFYNEIPLDLLGLDEKDI